MPRWSPPMTRFFSRVEIAPDGCWIWIGAKNQNGYGVFMESKGRSQTSAHRVLYEWVHGVRLDRSQVVDHLCRNKACVNPAHLEAVSQRENMRRGIKGVLTTHCPRNHEYTPENTYLYEDKRGYRMRNCKTCAALREIIRKEARAARREVPLEVV